MPAISRGVLARGWAVARDRMGVQEWGAAEPSCRGNRVAGVVLFLDEGHLVSSPERTTCNEASHELGAVIFRALVSTSSSRLLGCKLCDRLEDANKQVSLKRLSENPNSPKLAVCNIQIQNKWKAADFSF